ncbi:MAG TPA: recombination mediator RecR [Bacilli bacterium]|jgi:recombination protein RecR|nr:recombination mediator RecR [Bacilli bacterium]HPV69438.1 recombination mediator RecR [Bacilli bacterium]
MKDLKSLTRLIDSFGKLPSVGRKSAERMALAILEMEEEDVKEFSLALEGIKHSIRPCPICGLYTEDEKCEICSDAEREEKTLIVVSSYRDVYAFEKLNTFRGRYHILGGVLSAVAGVGIEDLNIDSLLSRIEDNKVEEIILATNPTIEGETTALFIAKLLEGKGVEISRLAYGLPMGGHVDYADSLTLNKALEGRRKI